MRQLSWQQMKSYLLQETLTCSLVIFLFVITLDAFGGAGALVRWGALLFLVAAIVRKDWILVPSALLFFFLYVAGLYFPAAVWRFPSAGFLVPFFLTAIVCYPFESLRREFRWLRRGQLDQVSWALILLTSLISALALVLWALWTDYLGLASAMLNSVRAVPRWLLVMIGIPGFALMNAFAEEVVYRGILLESLSRKLPERKFFVISLQASAFAAAHVQSGFPNGKIGYLMTFSYACMLGFLRMRTMGMLAPYLAHVAADTVIGFTLLLLAS